MLRLRRPRPPRDEDGAVLVPHGLRVQPVDQPLGRRVARQLEERGVQVGVRVRGAEEVARLEQLPVSCERRTQPLRSGLVDPLGGQANGETLEHGAGLEDLDRLTVRDLTHARAAVRLPDDEALLLEPDQRISDGAARHVEARHDVGLDEPGVRRDLAADDRLAELVVVRVGVVRESGHEPLPAKSSTCSPK